MLQRTDRLEAQLWPRDGFRFVCLFVKGFFPPCGRLCILFPGCKTWRRVHRAVRGTQTRAGRCRLWDGTGQGAVLGCAAEGFFSDRPRLEESSNRAGKMGLPPCLQTQLQSERGDSRRMRKCGVFRNTWGRWRRNRSVLCVVPWEGCSGTACMGALLPMHFQAPALSSGGFACAAAEGGQRCKEAACAGLGWPGREWDFCLPTSAVPL